MRSRQRTWRRGGRLGLRRLFGLASIKGTLSHEGASKDIKSKAETAYATGGHARPVLETEVSPRDQDTVSQHETQGADAALAELADAHNKGGDAIDAAAHGDGDPAASIKGTLSHVEDAPQTITSEAAAFDTEDIEGVAGEGEALSGSTARNAAAEMVKSRLATQTTRPAYTARHDAGSASQRRLQTCDSGQVPDCSGVCCPASWIGDGVCDDGNSGCDFRCEDNDGGDCGPLPTPFPTAEPTVATRPEPCVCKASWSNTDCSTIQEGCPAEGSECETVWGYRWCEVDPSECSSAKEHGDYHYIECDDTNVATRPEPRACLDTWSTADCTTIQEGCPTDACDGSPYRWCEVDPSECSTALPYGDYYYIECDDTNVAPPEHCVCLDTWSNADCSTIQEGCPTDACDGSPYRWCEV
ncbi:unnamed protein product, partial [Pelagomonas calceolata]